VGISGAIKSQDKSRCCMGIKNREIYLRKPLFHKGFLGIHFWMRRIEVEMCTPL
jgi:hypothetical protein